MESAEWDEQWEDDGNGLRFIPRSPSAEHRVSGARRPLVVSRRQSLEDGVVRLVNQERAAAGLNALRTEEMLRQSSRAHSEAMAARDFFDHLDPDGTSPADRMYAAGYRFPGAENIAVHLPNAWEVVRAWMASPGHRANILNPDFRAIGAGLYWVPGARLAWWTQNFGYV
ncbi:CAP domain-containing protein [Streptomyces sp. YS415]|uniref:CAP domain-containing protein n=1 Tax=Streptomyces sp. YS415 TaxID=2944806 RepID=UPI002020DA5D|nr:CAP domain-containing protein [Streptomyces sp. YS415]MCL7430181.1 CAP domain-containing protein [Streptomyces sp. YS415]